MYITLFLTQDTRWRQSYYRTWARSHMRSIEWCHFQWSWM